MGQDIEAVRIGAEDPRVYGEKLRRSLGALDQMLGEKLFDVGPSQVGMEIELHLVDAQAAPSMRNEQVLDAITEPASDAELGRFNLEVNVPHGPPSGAGLAELERQVRASLNAADEQARSVGSRLVMIGILPTLREQHLSEAALSANARYLC
jgi:gamma-glutamyl:cysteine ligase YbdK (ATP-grasp superfamily)